MPQGGNGTRTETTAGIRTETGMELASSEANIEQEIPANFVTVTSGVPIAHPSITRPTGTATISFVPTEGEMGVAVTQVQSPQPPATVAATTSTSTTTGSAEATASSSEMRMDNSSSQNAGESSRSQAVSSQNTPSNQQGETPTQAEGQGGDGAQATASSEQNQLPEIDPSFLAALPDSIRQEVLAQHEREQRRLRAQREGASLASTISPEFLAALPLNIQEEVGLHTIMYTP